MRLRIVLLVAALTLGLQSFVSADNFFDGRYKNIGDTVRGVSSSISTAPEPNLHGGYASSVWCLVHNSADTRYAQAGYAKWADEETMLVFAQWIDEEGPPPHTVTAGAPGSDSHTYTCIQNGATGNWTFFYEAVPFAVAFNTAWAGSVIEFFGEVSPDKGVQMMGDANPEIDKLKFTYFRYLPAECGGWTTVWPSTYENDGWPDWGQDVSQANGYFKIWDTTP